MKPPVFTSHLLRPLWLLLAFLLTTAAVPAQAEDTLPAAPQGRVSDYAGLLDPTQRQALTAQLTQYELSMRRPGGGGPQIVLAIFPDLGGTPVEDVAVRLAGRWKIGSKADDGVLLMLALKEHEVRIEVGYGVEGQLPDVVASRIIRELMVPRLRAGDFPGGLRAGLAGIHQSLTGAAVTGQDEFTTGSSPPAPAPQQVDRLPLGWLIIGGGVLVLLLLLLVFGGPGVRGFLLGIFFNSLFGGGRRGGSSGGGFSGGGGSFGGGGATGKW